MFKKIIPYFLFISCVYGQDKIKSNIGLGIEAGAGYSTLKSSFNDKSIYNFDTVYKWNSFNVQPTARFYYNLNFKSWGINIFTGYNQYGGTSKVYSNGYQDKITFKSGEFGFIPHFKIKEFLRIGVGIKGQYNFAVWGKYNGSYYQLDSVPRKWQTEDITENYQYFGANAGLNVKYIYKHITLSLESWYGISNLNAIDIDKDFGTLKVKENNYRLLIGYEF